MIIPLINRLQDLPGEVTSLILFSTCIIAMLILFKLFGKPGLYIYNIVAILVANIQVLKGVQLFASSHPIALGTIVFSSTYICSGILTEHYGKLAAKYNIWYCFAAQILMSLFMIITIGHAPLPKQLLTPATSHMLLTEQAISLLFTPSLRLLLSSMLAFICAQTISISIFYIITKFFIKKYLWLRTIILIVLATFIDTFIFNTLAWRILSSNPASYQEIFYTYIFWTLITQLFITILSMPIIYLSYKCKTNPVFSELTYATF